MKKFLFLSVACAAFLRVSAQQPFICTEPGAVLETAEYDAKGKLTGYERQVIESCEKNADGWLEVTCRVKMLDAERNPVQKKGSEIVTHTVVRESDMILPLDEIMFSSVASSGDGASSLVKTEGNEYTYPLTMSVGTRLSDVLLVSTVYRGGEATNMKFQLTVVDRNVLARERVTVPVGTFDAYKITETIAAKILFINVSQKVVSWVVPGIGTVRSESQSKKGKLNSYSELVSFQRPAAQ